jgi:hypothetical protein
LILALQQQLYKYPHFQQLPSDSNVLKASMAIFLKNSGLFKALFGQILGSVLWDHEHVPARAHMSHSEKSVVETMIYFSLQRTIAD